MATDGEDVDVSDDGIGISSGTIWNIYILSAILIGGISYVYSSGTGVGEVVYDGSDGRTNAADTVFGYVFSKLLGSIIL